MQPSDRINVIAVVPSKKNDDWVRLNIDFLPTTQQLNRVQSNNRPSLSALIPFYRKEAPLHTSVFLDNEEFENS